MATDTSRLLKLPAEIRNRIYELVFADSTVIIQKAQKNVYRPESIGILTACRQTYKESIGYFYSLTTFYGQWRTLATFVIRLSRRYAEFITSLRIHHIDHSDGAAGLTYSHADCAFETQRTIFLMDDYFGKRCRNVPEGIIESKALVFQHDQQWYGTLWTCSPWQAYMERLSEIPGKFKSINTRPLSLS